MHKFKSLVCSQYLKLNGESRQGYSRIPGSEDAFASPEANLKDKIISPSAKVYIIEPHESYLTS